MISTPQLIERPAQPYVAIPARVTMQSMMGLLPKLWPEVAGWLGARGFAPSGAPLIRWVVIDMAREMQIEIGFPVAHLVVGDDRVHAGALPAGRYAVAVHSGHYDQLVAAHAALQEWARRERVSWAVDSTADGEAWAARIESYTTDPGVVANPADWKTEISYLVAAVGDTTAPAAVKRAKRRTAKKKPAKKAKKTARRAAKKPKRAVKKSKRAAARPKRKAARKAKRAARPKRRVAKKVKRRPAKNVKRRSAKR